MSTYTQLSHSPNI